MNAAEYKAIILEDLQVFKKADFLAFKPSYLLRCICAFGFHGEWINGPAQICGGIDMREKGEGRMNHEITAGQAAVYLPELDRGGMQFYAIIDTYKLLQATE